MNRLLSKTPDPSFGASAVTFTYTRSGKRNTMVDPSGTTTYLYDGADLLQQKLTPQGSFFYQFDLAGNLTTLSGGANVNYGYDALNRLATVTEINTGTTSYSYDAVGNLASVTYPSGVTHAYTYDPRNRLTNLAVNKSATPLVSYAYTLDASGHRTSVAELSGRTVNYSYDNLYRLTQEAIASDPGGQNGVISYTYDPVGNRKQMTSSVPAIPAGLFFYDTNDRLTTDTYDANGNTTNSGGIGFVYDFENRLIQKGGITIVYDGDGKRVKKTVAGITTTYLVDDLNPTGFAQVLQETFRGSNSLTQELQRTYVYGLERISQRRSFLVAGSGQTQNNYYVYDGHGSVRALSDQTGNVTDTYDYDAFGNLIHSTGTTPNNYLLAGEQFDPDLGLYYNRARYLNTSTGRFWTMDTFEGDPGSPASLHKYLYAEGDPVNRIDPSGHQVIAVVAVTIAVLAIVAALAYFHYHPRPFKIGLYWNTGFSWKNFRRQKHSPEGPLTSNEVQIVKDNALDALKRAYSAFGAIVTDGRLGTADHTVEVTDTLPKGCGQTRTSPSYYSFVSYDCVMNRAQFALPNYERADVIPAIGRGIGNIGAHEVGHQLALTVVNQDLDLPGYYDGGSDSDPSIYDGTGQQWTGRSLEELPSKVRPFF